MTVYKEVGGGWDIRLAEYEAGTSLEGRERKREEEKEDDFL